MDNALDIYESLARPPKSALKQITAGKLKDKTDINPQWRYKAMTAKFGLVGIGWKYEIQKLWTESGAGSESLAFAQVAVYVNIGGEWSDPIVGIGGSKLVQIEKGAPVSNDEGYKMAVTDAFSTALKMLGVAADIYAGMWDGSKYKDNTDIPPQVEAVANTFNGEVVQEKDNTNQKLYDLGLEVSNLLKTVNAQKQLIFNEQEIKSWQATAQDKYKAKDLVGLENVVKQIKEELQRKVSPAPVNNVIPAQVQQEIF